MAESYLWIAVAKEGLQLRKIFSYLETVRGRYSEKYDCSEKKLDKGKYSEYMGEQMTYWATDPNADKITSVLTQVEEVKDVMVENLRRVLFIFII